MRTLILGLVVLCTSAAAANAQDDQLATDLASAIRNKNDNLVVTCNGDIAGFSARSVESISGHVVSLKAKSRLARITGDAALRDSVARWTAIEMIEIALTNGYDGAQEAGGMTLSVATSPEGQTCNVSRLISPHDTVEFERPLLSRQFALGGNVVAWSLWEDAKPRFKGKPAACRVHLIMPEPPKGPLAPTLMTALEEAAAKANRGGPTGGHDSYVLVLGIVKQPVGTFAGFGFISNDAVELAYRVTDQATGKLVTRGRKWATIGRKAEKDVREAAAFIPCA
jgi:hypothetical protein